MTYRTLYYQYSINICLEIRSGSVFADQNGPTLNMTLTVSTCKRPLTGMQVYIIISFIQVIATWASIPATGLFSISQAGRQAPFYLNIRHLLTLRPTKNYTSIWHIIHKWTLFFYSSNMWILPDTLTNVLIINPNTRLYKASS